MFKEYLDNQRLPDLVNDTFWTRRSSSLSDGRDRPRMAIDSYFLVYKMRQYCITFIPSFIATSILSTALYSILPRPQWHIPPHPNLRLHWRRHPAQCSPTIARPAKPEPRSWTQPHNMHRHARVSMTTTLKVDHHPSRSYNKQLQLLALFSSDPASSMLFELLIVSTNNEGTTAG